MNISTPLHAIINAEFDRTFESVMRTVHNSNAIVPNFKQLPWHTIFENHYHELYNITVVGARQIGKTTACVSMVMDMIADAKPRTIAVISHSRNAAEHIRKMITNTILQTNVDSISHNNKCSLATLGGVEVIFGCKSTFNTMVRGYKLDLTIIDCDIDDLGILPCIGRVVEFRDTHHPIRSATMVVPWLKAHYTKDVSGYKLRELEHTMTSVYGETLFNQYYELK